MRLLRIDFVEGKRHPVYTFMKTFQLCFYKRRQGFTYEGCFCWQDYPRCFIKSNNRIVKNYEILRAPTIIVAKQSNFLKTLETLIHELGHYVIWLLFCWNCWKKTGFEEKPKLYAFFDEWYDRIFTSNSIYL